MENSLIVLDVLIKALKLSDLEREDSHQNHDHQQEGVDSPLDQVLHLHSDSYSDKSQWNTTMIFLSSPSTW